MNRLLGAARTALESLRSVARRVRSPTGFETGESAVSALNRCVAYSAAAACAVVVAYEFFTLAAMMNQTRFPAVVHTDQPAPQQAASDTASRAIDGVADAHLFGVFEGHSDAPLVQQRARAPDTTLDVKLTGILFGKDMQHREAIIASSGHERTYRAGQEIDDAAGATVRDVLADSVVLEREGTAEMLRLVNYVEAPLRNSAASAGARLLRTPLRPPRNDFLRLMRKTEDGQVGFAVMPGPNRDAFDTLGLQSNDVVTRIDGVAFGDRGGDSLLLERLASGGSLTLTVLRSGASQEVHVDANRLAAGGG